MDGIYIYINKLLWFGRSALTFGNRYMEYDAGNKNGEKKTAHHNILCVIRVVWE